MRAIRDRHIVEHPLAAFAWLLGTLHRGLLEHPDEQQRLARARATAVVEINEWVDLRRSRPLVPLPSPATVGEVIDRMAQAQVMAYRLLMRGDVEKLVVHYAWHRLGRVVDEYHDLAEAIEHRQHPFPFTKGGAS
ncbi:hypothetical protein [Nocardia sp. NPDC052566]|uniref:hypothetical protein n=1 Tax=Nocardia sp. NPDC052566 TaxID=3364330 RepID=UPI0037C8E231